jgi:hypothetical protein
MLPRFRCWRWANTGVVPHSADLLLYNNSLCADVLYLMILEHSADSKLEPSVALPTSTVDYDRAFILCAVVGSAVCTSILLVCEQIWCGGESPFVVRQWCVCGVLSEEGRWEVRECGGPRRVLRAKTNHHHSLRQTSCSQTSHIYTPNHLPAPQAHP